MVMPPSIPTVLGTLAVFATAALVAVHSILAHGLGSPLSSSTKIVAVVSAALEGVVLVTLCVHLVFHLRRKPVAGPASYKRQQQQPSQRSGALFGLSIILCSAAAAVSVAALVCLAKSNKPRKSQTKSGTDIVSLLAGASVTLGVSYAAQLLFLIVLFIASRTASSPGAVAQGSSEEDGRIRGNGRSSSSRRVKSVRYSQTSSPGSDHHHKSERTRGTSMSSTHASHSPPGSSGAGSATETMSSFRSSLSHIVRPISSKTRLLARDSSGSQRSQRRPTSTPASSSPPANTQCTTRDSVAAQPNPVEDFDSWDTSAVDPHNRQTVLESSSPIPGRFLETIPASPTTSRSASPGGVLDLEPPRSRRRSRSFSPAGSSTRSIGIRARSQSHSQSPTNEAHIHPLFRSDSPTPPPAMVSAGTIVTAAPNGGQIITDAQGLRTISRMRSGSLPAVSSPLSRQGSFDDFGVQRGAATSPVAMMAAGNALPEEEMEVNVEDDYAESADRQSQPNNAERKMTPPIPDWILSAGARSSLTDYENRKIRYEDGARPNETTHGMAF